MMNDDKFFKLCAGHDWYYMFSDDATAYHKGVAERRVITSEAKSNPNHQEVYESWVRYKSSGGAVPSQCCFLEHQAV